MVSKCAREVNDQYFTPIDTAKWCFEEIHNATGWQFEGTALEPAVGGFAFVDAAEELGLKLEWVTNDLFPQPGERQPDFTEDFKKATFGSFDYVIGNPPFGRANCLARVFVSRSLKASPRVAMILPKGARRVGFIDLMPENAWCLADLNLPDQTFQVVGHGQKQVQTCVQAWEVREEKRPSIRQGLDLRTDLITTWSSFKENGGKESHAQVCRWGAMGRVREESIRSGSWESVHFQGEMDFATFSEICGSLDFSDYKEKCSGAPAFDPCVFLHRFNQEAVRRGLLPPAQQLGARE